MEVSTVEWAQARDAVTDLLESLNVEAYGFDLEPAGSDDWLVQLEYATPEGWQARRLSVRREELASARADADRRRALLETWRAQLH